MPWSARWRKQTELRAAAGEALMSTEPVDHPSTETVQVRQGTGPRNMVLVLLLSLVAAAIAGLLIVGYFVRGS
jgi:hypothetical protein